MAGRTPSLAPDDEFADKVKHVADGLAKLFGKDSVHLLGEAGAYASVDRVVPTGIPFLDDEVIGVGGIPMPKLTEISGPESAGKTTLCRKIVAQCQATHVIPLYFDCESSILEEWDDKLGVKPKLGINAEPEFMEDLFEKMVAAIDQVIAVSAPGLLIWDSVAALRTKKELEMDFDDKMRPAMQSSFLSWAIPKLVHHMKHTDVGAVFINQVRDKFDATAWGDQIDTPGGRALKHFCHLRLQIKRIQWVTEKVKGSDQTIRTGLVSEIRAIKNKVAPPQRTCKIKITWADGNIEGVK